MPWDDLKLRKKVHLAASSERNSYLRSTGNAAAFGCWCAQCCAMRLCAKSSDGVRTIAKTAQHLHVQNSSKQLNFFLLHHFSSGPLTIRAAVEQKKILIFFVKRKRTFQSGFLYSSVLLLLQLLLHGNKKFLLFMQCIKHDEHFWEKRLVMILFFGDRIFAPFFVSDCV